MQKGFIMSNATFVGFGFGAIQSGLFLTEAFNSGKFDRLVVAEVNPARVEALRQNKGAFSVNIATATERVVQTIDGVEILNPSVPGDAARLIEALTEATEVATALPSVEFFDRGSPSVAGLLREALRRKMATGAPPAVIYTAENNNHAAERLEKDVFKGLSSAELAAAGRHMQMLNTVIGKMSSVVVDPAQIGDLCLTPLVPDASEAFLVESFNRILISQISLPEFERRIGVFEEKADLLPFEEAKLYGHNAIHALLGYLANERELRTMSELAQHRELLTIGQIAFIQESGAALIAKYKAQDPLFTETGFAAYADDLLGRMLNPYLQDSVDRVVRDPLRKLGWNDRLIGAARLAIAQNIQPYNLLAGARAALRTTPSGASLRLLAKQWKSEGAKMIPIQLTELF
jgi:mannitol-1-phosphate 5-dehydrogenase